MRTVSLVRDKNEIIGELFDIMYDYVCKQKKLLEELKKSQEQIAEKEAEDAIRVDRSLVKGVGGLAEYLGCGKNKAQEILNSRVLQSKEIAYRAGNRWVINTARLDEELAENPELLNKLPKTA